MHAVIALFFFLAQPFWETKPPEKWTDREIDTVLHSSPWVEAAGPEPAVLVYFATAAPIEEAEAQLRARASQPAPMLDPDYLDYVRDNRDHAFILGIPFSKLNGLGNAGENKRMQTESRMKVGKKTYQILGHFPPTPTDPVLRLVFPREVKSTDKTVEFQLYIPGVPFPERDVLFYVKDLVFHDKVEM
jgi:hypothetical protein